jgi:hypothetical protein
MQPALVRKKKRERQKRKYIDVFFYV